MVDTDGLELTFQYESGALVAVTDSYGRSATFQWIAVGEEPAAISVIALPDGTTLNYTYETISTTGTAPDRLVRVERKQGATLLDKTSYEYGNAQFPTFVTGVKDKNDVLRWSVAYDSSGRATSSTGPSSADTSTVAYGASGATFTRTVTTPLYKSVIYTYTRTGTNYNVKLTSIAEQVSANSPERTTSYTYSTSNYIASATDAEGRVTGYTRDASARPTQIVEAQGTSRSRTTNLTWHANRNAPTQLAEPGLTIDDSFSTGTSAGPYTPPYVVTQNFAYSGAAQTYTVPSGVTSATIELWGGGGGNGNVTVGAWSGAGGYIKATFTVAPGDLLKFEVAGGGQGTVQSGDGGLGGWPDGGPGSKSTDGDGGGGGGGSSRFYINNVLKAVAGGGGGSGGKAAMGKAGAGGGLVGQSGEKEGGTGGAQSAGGIDSNDTGNANKTGRSIIAFPGVQRTGGWGATNGSNTIATSGDGGGGGGGYWGGGGGGGDSDPGGGGSSWVDASGAQVQIRSGYWSTPFSTPAGQPTVALGVNSAVNGPAVPGGNGYATLGVR